MNATIASFQAIFTHCSDPTALVQGTSVVSSNAAFVSRFGDVTSLLELLNREDHDAALVAQDAGLLPPRFTARLASGDAAGTPMRWSAWTLGEGITCVRLDGEAPPNNPRFATIAPILPKDKPAPDLAWILYELFHHIDAIVFAMDMEGTILLSEGNGLAHFGLKPGQIVGTNMHRLYEKGSVAEINLRKALNGEKLHTSTLEGSNSLITWYDPVRDTSGKQTGLVGISIFTNANAKAMVEAQSLVAAIEQLPVAMWAMEKSGICLLSTGNGLRDLGLEPGWLVGKNLFEVYAEHPAFALDMARVFAGEHVTQETRIGEMTWRNHFVPARGIISDEVVRVYAVAENITERKQNEQRLEEQLNLIQTQQHAIAGLSCPIIEVWQGVLVVPLIGNLDEKRAGILVEQLLNAVVSRQALSVILDLTGIDDIEASTAPHLFNILRSVELLGASGLISGIRPGVARTMVELDIPLAANNTYPTLAEALRRLIRVRKTASNK